MTRYCTCDWQGDKPSLASYGLLGSQKTEDGGRKTEAGGRKSPGSASLRRGKGVKISVIREICGLNRQLSAEW